MDVATGLHFDLTRLAQGTNAGMEYIEDRELRIVVNAAHELAPVFVGRSFIFVDDRFFATDRTGQIDRTRPWLDFSTVAIIDGAQAD